MKETTDKTFLTDISQGYVLVDFWASWCAPCRTLAPYLEEASKKLEDVTVLKLNIDENKTGQEYGVRGIPTLILFKNGVEVNRFSGARPTNAIVSIVRDMQKKHEEGTDFF